MTTYIKVPFASARYHQLVKDGYQLIDTFVSEGFLFAIMSWERE